MLDRDRILGALLGTAVGDALGMPIDGLSHQNVRTYYKGIKDYRADEHRRDLGAGQWTVHTQRTFALVRALAAAPTGAATAGPHPGLLPNARRASIPTPSVAVATAVAPFGTWWAIREGEQGHMLAAITSAFLAVSLDAPAQAVAFGQTFAVRALLNAEASTLDGTAFFRAVTERTRWAEDRLGGPHAVSDRLRLLADHLDDFPLDLQDLCDGTGPAADEAWPFAVAMVARNPLLLEATLLPAINVGGAASAIGALVGALVGALHGWAAFPEDWRSGLEDRDRLEAEANAFVDALLTP